MNKQTTTSIVTGLFLLAFGGGAVQAAPVSWSTPSGFVRSNGVTPLLESGSALFQLVYSADEIADPPGPGGGTSGDDVVWAQKVADSSTAGLYGQHFAAAITHNFETGCLYVRVFDAGTAPGNVPLGTAYFTGPVAWPMYYLGLPNLNQEVREGVFAAGLSLNGMGHFVLNEDEYVASPLAEALDAPGLAWAIGDSSGYGYYKWEPTIYTTHDGVDAALGSVGPDAETWLETTVIGPIAVSFWWRIDLQSVVWGSWLRFTIDGEIQSSVEGWSDWQYSVFAVSAGTHTLRWVLYGGQSDPFYGGGGAYGYLDQVTLSPIAPEIEILGRDSIGITNGASTTSTNNGTDFGAVFLTGATGDQTFAVRNWGVTNLDISAVTVGGTHSGDFQIVAYPGTVAANSSSNLILRFDPTDVGGRTATITVVNNDADEGSYSFAVSGTGLPDNPVIRIQGSNGATITNGSTAATNTLGTDFGWQYLTGAGTPRTFYVTNAGNSILNISAVSLTGANSGDFAVLSYPATVAAGARSNLVLHFDPAAVGARAAVVEISSDALGAPIFTFSVGGLGVPDEPEILVLGTNGWAIFDGDMIPTLTYGSYFGGVPAFTGSADRTFRITNSGSADLIISGVEFQGSGAAHFSAPSVPARVSPGTASNLAIRFSPAAAGAFTAVVAIANNDADENPYEFAVRGDGTAAHYVWTNSPSPTPPYLTWETAARTIQEAVSICVDGDVVWATNGVYDSGEIYLGSATNRVGITNVIRLCSINGPEVTQIAGAGGIRGIYLGQNSILAGFTVTNGQAGTGGGVYGQNTSAVVSNGVITGNQADYGGGIYNATVYDSRIEGNVATYGGGGASYATLHRCRIVGNQSGNYEDSECCSYDPMFGCWDWATVVSGGGGGAYYCKLNSCLLVDNFATAGGGASYSSLTNCTLVSNQASGAYDYWSTYLGGGGGIFAGSAVNCIFSGNVDSAQPGKSDWDVVSGCWTRSPAITYSCLTNPPVGVGNVTGQVMFVAGTFQLASGSLGIDMGNNASVQGTTDLAGNPRIANGTVDMGAYEFVPQAILPDADGDGIPDDWENGHGLSSSVSNAPTADSDGDGHFDLEEYWADTHPNNGASFFPMVVVTNPPLGAMVLIVNPSSTARVYGVRWTTNLLSIPQIWTLIPPEKMGTGSGVSFTVTNDGPGRIYRTGVRLP